MALRGRNFVLMLRQALGWTLLAAGTLGLTAASGPARAQGKLEAHYSVTLAGIPIGAGDWTVDIADAHYNASANGTTTGLMRAFTGGKGSSAARGTFNGGKPTTAIYSSTISTRKKTDTVRFTTNAGSVKELALDPPQDKDPDRIPITEAHQHGVLDPMSASLVRVPGNGNLLTPEACQQSAAIFDGRLRYDLKLAFKRMDQVKADKGYAGPVVVCSVHFTPVAGYIPSRYAIKYIAKLRDIEVWLAPIAGTRVLAPFRAQGPTPVGEVVLEATQFTSVAAPARASANGTKTQ